MKGSKLRILRLIPCRQPGVCGSHWKRSVNLYFRSFQPEVIEYIHVLTALWLQSIPSAKLPAKQWPQLQLFYVKKDACPIISTEKYNGSFS